MSYKEKLISGLGGIVALYFVMLVSQQALHLSGAAMVIASMGASAVLLFAVPHGQLSQPWPVIGGHTLSALIGVACARYISSPLLAGAVAVGVAIAVMHHFKCIHPPGGATALTAVVGGPGVHALGFSFAWCPVLVNALTIVLVACLFNAFFRWRRYPAALNKRVVLREPEISHEEVVDALKSFDSFVDISEDDLVRLHQLLSYKRSLRKPLTTPVPPRELAEIA